MSDIALDASNNFVFQDGKLGIVTEADYIAQKIRIRFRFVLGEWFLDTRLGIPYFRDVLVKNPNMELIRALFRRVLATTPGVIALPRFELKLDAKTRTLSFAFHAVTTAGPLVFEPGEFLVEAA